MDSGTKPTIAARRLMSQQLTRSTLKTPAEVVNWLGVVQAQDYAGGKWTIGMRLPDSTEATVEQAIADRTIIRSWILRATLHFAAADDLRWMINLVAERLIAGFTRRYRELDLDHDTLMRSNDVLAGALQGGKQLSRPTLFEILEQQGLSTEGQRGVYMLSRASLDGLICQSGVERNTPIFMTIDSNVPQGLTLNREESLAELARRYFTSHGPATLHDFVNWTGLLISDARAGLNSVKHELTCEKIDGVEYYLSPSLPDMEIPVDTAYFLPSYDEYWIAYKDRGAIVDPADAKRVDLHNGFSPTIVLDGQVIGLWKRTYKKNQVMFETTLFKPVSDSGREAITRAAEQYATFHGVTLAPLTLT